MIKNVIDLLNTNEFYGYSERIEIAKGKYKQPSTFKEFWYKVKRMIKMKNNGR